MLHFGETGGSRFVRSPTRNLREARNWARDHAHRHPLYIFTSLYMCLMIRATDRQWARSVESAGKVGTKVVLKRLRRGESLSSAPIVASFVSPRTEVGLIEEDAATVLVGIATQEPGVSRWRFLRIVDARRARPRIAQGIQGWLGTCGGSGAG